MNVLYIHTHDTGRYIQPYGYGVSTPNLMEFARNGTMFRKAFCAAPTCSPSRAALLTGRAPHSCGLFGLAHRGFAMPDYSMHLAAYLRVKGGYETVLCGIQHEAPQTETLGYSRVLGNQDYDMGNTAFDGVAWDRENASAVAKYLQEEHRSPFFISYGMFNTHRRYPRHQEEQNPDYVMPPPTLCDTPENREDTADFMYSVQVADQCVGTVLRALEMSGLREKTAVIFTTDHGMALPYMKCNLYDAGTGVSLIVDFPGNRMRGRVVDALISQIDLYPTICELCQVEIPCGVQGISLLPIFSASAKEVRSHVFSEVNYHACYEPVRSVRTHRYKYIRRFDENLTLIPANIDNSPCKTLLIKNGLLDSAYAKEELYDLYFDPVERVNLAENIHYSKVKEQLERELCSWMRDTSDPLLYGKIMPPVGALLNRRDSLSAEDPLYLPTGEENQAEDFFNG